MCIAGKPLCGSLGVLLSWAFCPEYTSFRYHCALSHLCVLNSESFCMDFSSLHPMLKTLGISKDNCQAHLAHFSSPQNPCLLLLVCSVLWKKLFYVYLPGVFGCFKQEVNVAHCDSSLGRNNSPLSDYGPFERFLFLYLSLSPRVPSHISYR
jgi:hypothetical protein